MTTDQLHTQAPDCDKPVVGVVVIGRNEGTRLLSALKSVLVANVPVVYVDSRSTDNSVANASNLGVRVVELSPDRPINASRARNEGVAALTSAVSSVRYVHLLDGDSTLAPAWLTEATSYLNARPNVAFVAGRLREKDRETNSLRRLCDIEWYREPSCNAECGGLGVVRVEAFNAVGGLDETLIAGADPEFYARLKSAGWEVHTLDTAMGVHDSGMVSWRQWWTRSIKGGYAYAHARMWGGWRRERLSAILWGAVLPVVAVLGSLALSPVFSVTLLAYPIQAVRIRYGASKSIFSPRDRWLYAVSCLAIKFPQCIGIAMFEYRRIANRHGALIEYKKAAPSK